MSAVILDFASPERHGVLPPPTRERFALPSPAASPAGERVLANDGRALLLRPVGADDVAAMRRCFRRLSPEEVRRRFLHAMAELPEPMAQRLCNIDAACETAYVLIDEATHPHEMRGVGRIYVDEATNGAEFSVLVEHDWARKGLGALLMRRLVAECRRRDLDQLWGYVLLENRPMLHLCEELGFTRRFCTDEPGVVQLALLL